MKEISWDEFTQVELRSGRIVHAEIFKEARKPAYKLEIDFGEDLGRLKSSAQITDLYTIEELIGKTVIAVINFPQKQIGPFMSQCLVTGFYNDKGEVVLAVPDKEIKPGAKLL